MIVGGATDTLTIMQLGGGGSLEGNGLTANPDGTYTLAVADASTLTAELQALVFTPTGAAGGEQSTTVFTLVDRSSADETATDVSTSVTDTPDGTPTSSISISGARANQTAYGDNPVPLFSGMAVTDDDGGASDTLTITLSGAGGTLSGPGVTANPDGSYTLDAIDPTTITADLQAITFTPTAGTSSETTTFSVADQNSAGATANDETTTVTVAADGTVATAPTITGNQASQATQAEAPLSPFAGVTVTDGNAGAADTLSITLSGAGGFLSGDGLTANQDGSYTLTATDPATLTGELDALTFTPTAGAPGAQSTTGFTLTDQSSAGVSATDSTTSVIDTAAMAVTIAGTQVGQATAAEATLTPFAEVTIADGNAGAADTLTITLSGSGGTLTGTGLTANPDGSYTLAATDPATLAGELDALTFTPTAGAPGTQSTTGFTLADQSSAGAYASDASTTVIDTAAGTAPVAPTIAETESGQTTTAEAPVTPFSGVTVTDGNAGATDTLTITLSGVGGTLAGAGLTANPDGSYTLAATDPSSLTGELDALTFTPTAGAPGAQSTTGFTLTDQSSAGVSATDSATSVVDTAPVAPTIAGTQAGQTTTAEAPVTPFSGVTVTDGNAGATDTLTITLSGVGGTLAGAGLIANPDGSYTLAATDPATLTGELDALTFTPTAGAPGAQSTTGFTLTDQSSAGARASDAATTVTDTAMGSGSGTSGTGAGAGSSGSTGTGSSGGTGTGSSGGTNAGSSGSTGTGYSGGTGAGTSSGTGTGSSGGTGTGSSGSTSAGSGGDTSVSTSGGTGSGASGGADDSSSGAPDPSPSDPGPTDSPPAPPPAAPPPSPPAAPPPSPPFSPTYPAPASPHDPLALNLGPGQIDLTSLDGSSTRFDYTGTGFAVQTGWIGSTTALLVRVQDGDQPTLFGVQSGDGFADLAALDSNGDGVVDANDPAFGQLYAWFDTNQNGVIDPGELEPLSALGITSLSVTPTPLDETVDGNEVVSGSAFTRADGSVGEIAEIDFATDQELSTYTPPAGFAVDPLASVLPQLRGYGLLPDLDVAMSLDPTLETMVLEFVVSVPDLSAQQFDADFTDILYRWAGVDGVDPSAWGPKVDGRQYEFILKLFGIDPNGTNEYTAADPNWHNGGLDTQEFQAIKSLMEIRFAAQLGPILSGIFPDGTSADLPFAAFSELGFNSATDTISLDLKPMLSALGAGAPSDPAAAASYYAYAGQLLADLALDVENHLGDEPGLLLSRVMLDGAQSGLSGAALQAIASALTGDPVSVVDLSGDTGAYAAPGGANVFTLGPAEAASGNGGTPSAPLTVTGNGGSDVFVYWSTFGSDVVLADPNASLELADLTLADVNLERQGDDLVIVTNGTGATITVQGEFSQGAVSSLQFADGQILAPSDILSTAPLHLGAGDVSVQLSSGNVTTFAGTGNDTIGGGNGDDTFVYGSADGNLTINNHPQWWWNSDTATLSLTDLDPGEVTFEHAENGDLVITVTATGNTITVGDNFRSVTSDGIQQIAFADGTVWTRDQITTNAPMLAGDADATLDATPGDITLVAGAGTDVLNGAGGNDTMVAGTGTGTFNGGDGDDTFVYGSADGDLTINNQPQWWWNGGDTATLQLTDLDASDLTFDRTNAGDLVITVNATGSTITIPNTFSSSGKGIQQIAFADGTVWTKDQAGSLVLNMNNDTANLGDGATATLDGSNDTIGLGSNNTLIVSGENDVAALQGSNNVVSLDASDAGIGIQAGSAAVSGTSNGDLSVQGGLASSAVTSGSSGISIDLGNGNVATTASTPPTISGYAANGALSWQDLFDTMSGALKETDQYSYNATNQLLEIDRYGSSGAQTEADLYDPQTSAQIGSYQYGSNGAIDEVIDLVNNNDWLAQPDGTFKERTSGAVSQTQPTLR